MAEGCTGREVGQRLGITERTVKSHMDNIMAKLKAQNRVHAVAIAARLGLLGRTGSVDGGEP